MRSGCWLAWTVLASLAHGQYQIGSWTADNGLPISSVNRVLQTRDGYLWIATFGGLVRYDGASFQVFNTINSKGLSTSRLVSLFEDRDGNLWASTEGHGLIRYRDGAFTTYTLADGLGDSTPGGIFYDTQGHLCFDSEHGEMVEWRNGRFFPTHPQMPGERNLHGTFLGRNSSGAVWYSDKDGLHRYEHDRIAVSIPLILDFKRVYETRSGGLWIEYGHADGSRTLAFYQNGKLTNYTQKEGVPSFRTFSALEDRHGAMWFGLQGEGGLLRIQDGKITRFTTADGLPSNNVGGPYEDREGTIWIPSTGGLSWITRQAVHAYSHADGLVADNVYPILQDRSGAIWIGSWMGLTKYVNGVFHDAGKLWGLIDWNVMSLFEDREGVLWIGTWGGGVHRVRGGEVEKEGVPGDIGPIVRAVIQDAEGNIWGGGPDGLARYRNGSFRRVQPGEGFVGLHVFSLFVDRGGSLWIGTDAGVSRYAGGVFTNFNETNGFSGKVVRSFYEDADGVLWLGTYDTGLYRYANRHFTQFTTREGLLDNGAFRIMEDQRGNLWLSCNVGIYRVQKKDLVSVAEGHARSVTSVTYGKRDGMLSAECNGGGQPAGIQARDGRFWFPTQKGVAVIDPNSIASNDLAPPVVIEEFTLDQQTVPANRTIEIQPGQGNLEIQYAALTFLRPELAKFKYKMVNLDPDWIDVGNRRRAYYSHLPYGTYEFRVIAANRDGVWNEQGAVIQVRSIPPFYRTWWFDLTATASLGGLATLVLRRKMRSAQQHHAAQEAFARQLIESQEKERKRIAGELHDSLSQTLSIIKNRAVLSMQNGNQDRTLDQMEEIASAAGEALAEIREIVNDLRPVEIDRLGLTRAIEALARKVTGSSGIQVSVEADALDGIFSGETEMNLYRIVQEGLSNIVKHSGASAATISLRRDTEGVEIVLRDDGKGFDPHTAAEAASHGTGLGLVSISERARIIGARMHVSSSPGMGTTLSVRLRPEDSANGN